MKLTHIASLLLVAALTAVWARRIVNINAPSKVFAEQGYNVRFNFGIRSLDRNMSLNESLVQVTKYNATELPEAFEYQLKPLMSEDSEVVTRMIGKVRVENVTCEHHGKYIIRYGEQQKGRTVRISIKGCRVDS